MIAASVVDFPDPVGPVTKTKPLLASANSNKTGGKLRLSILGILLSILLRTAAGPRKVL